MSYFQLSSLRLFQNLGRDLTGADWDYNWSQFPQVLSGNPTLYDVNFGNILGTTVIAPVIGNASSVLYGDGSNLTGSAVNKREYSTFIKYLYKSPSLIELNNVQAGNVTQITAELGIDAGIMLDTLDATTGWTGADAGTNITTDTTNYLNGSACVTMDKDGSNVLARIIKTFTAWNGTGGRVRVDCKVTSLTNFASLRVYFHTTAGTAYAFYNVTTDVEGNPIKLGWNKIEINLSDAPSATVGAFNVGVILRVDLGFVTSVAATTSTGIGWQDLLYYLPASTATLLDVDVITDYNTVLKDGGDNYTFEALHAGIPVTKTIFTTPAVGNYAVLSIFPKNVPATYAGQNLKITITVQ